MSSLLVLRTWRTSLLPAPLHYDDAVSMAHSVEARQAFLDYRLIELSMSLPEKWKMSNGETTLSPLDRT